MRRSKMDYSPRHGRILTLLGEEGSIGVSELAQRLDVSVETVRRDIKALAGRGDIVRMHGAVGLPAAVSEAPFERRMRENRQAKEAIARLDHRRLTVVTNSSDIARTLATVNGNKVYMAGGELRSDSGAALGFSAIEFVNRFSVDHAIISAGAVNAATGVMDYDLEEAQFGQAVLARGRRRVVVTDASKFGQKGLVRVCALSDFGEMIVNRAPPDDLAEALRNADVAIRVCA
jgi:DeoR family glycerol-3-phosphate regulon repressor